MEEEVGITINFCEDKSFMAVSEMLGGLVFVVKNRTRMTRIGRIITDILIRLRGSLLD
jgi:hypothetical protein